VDADVSQRAHLGRLIGDDPKVEKLAFTLAALTACGRIDFDDVSIAQRPWGPPEPWSLSLMGDDPSLTGDLLEMYINVGSQDLYVTKRATTLDAWSDLMLVAELDVAAAQSTPEVSADGLTLYFASARPGGLGADDIWVTTRAARADVWGVPIDVAAVSSPNDDHPGEASVDALATVLDSHRKAVTDCDLYLATRASTGDVWGMPVELAAINLSGITDESPALSADGLTLYFDSDRSGNYDLYIAQRSSTADLFSDPQPIAELDTDGDEFDPWISPDDHDLVFTRAGHMWHASR